MNSRLGLFRDAVVRITRRSPIVKRNLVTNHIYPYPHHHIMTKVHKSVPLYRETWDPEQLTKDRKMFMYAMRTFWTFWWYQFFSTPEAFLGHFPTNIDPRKWTDEELGIPPDEEGSYYKWFEKERVE